MPNLENTVQVAAQRAGESHLDTFLMFRDAPGLSDFAHSVDEPTEGSYLVIWHGDLFYHPILTR
jgi:hypothetical protein